MSTASSTSQSFSAADQLRYAREILQIEGQALFKVAQRLDNSFCMAVDLVQRCSGSVIVTGMGKAGLIGQKITATLSSTGARAHFLHPGEAVHGDLGKVGADDIVLALSQSGETEELTRVLPSLVRFSAGLVAITGKRSSTLGKAATVVLEMGPLQEACALGLAPSTSTTVMAAVGDALALVVSRLRGFGPADFARFHPAGSLGRKLMRVEEAMRPLAECRAARDALTVRQVLAGHQQGGRRSGAILLIDEAGLLAGLFTDSDLARLFERRRDAALDRPIHEVMTRRPCTVPAGSMLQDALSILTERKFSELPVIDAAGRPLGLLDITDLVSAGAPLPAIADDERSAAPTLTLHR
ncbi:MAG: KpsF/GutQ family sugar-phosphate isomerase [Pirellulales bacterium]